MALLDKIKGRPPSVEALQEKLTQALEAEQQAEADYKTACLAATDGGAAEQKARTAAEKALDKAKRDVRELRSAIEAAGQYEAEAADKAQADDLARRWDEVHGHVKERDRAAQDAEAAAAKLADAMDRIAVANTGILDALPSKPTDLSSALIATWDLEAALRLQLVKAGFAWAFSWPWGAESIPPFSKRIAEANAYVTSAEKRDAA